MLTRSLSNIVLATAVAFTLVGCGGDEAVEPEAVEPEVAAPAEPEVAAPVETDPADIDPDAPESSSDDSGASAAPTDSAGAGAGAASPASGPIELVETSFDISLAGMEGDEEPLTVTVPNPGTYTFRVTNEADIVHALAVEGQGMEAATGDIAPGATATLEVMLPAPGEYDLYCPVGNHKSQGMDGSVEVGG